MGKTNQAPYPKTQEPEIDYINKILYDFFERPNQELIQLMHSTGHEYFKQFKQFQSDDETNTLNSNSQTNEVILFD